MSKATTTYQLRLAALRAQGLAADVAAAAAEAIEEVEAAKADKAKNLTATIASAGWAKEEPETDGDGEIEQTESDFPYYYDITDAQITENDEADVHIVPSSISAARACGFSTVVETMEGKIRVRAQLQPEADILVQCSIKKGATQ